MAMMPGEYLLVATVAVGGRPYRGVQARPCQRGAENQATLKLESGIDLVGSLRIEGDSGEVKPLVVLTPGDALPYNSESNSLVVPDGALWKVDYSSNGTRSGDPLNVDQCSFYVGRSYSAGDRMRGTSLTISHLEFVTLAGLESKTNNILHQGNSWFPTSGLSAVAADLIRVPTRRARV